MSQKDKQAQPATLPMTGKSRWSKVEPFSPVSREKYRTLALEGKAPQPERLGIRCTFYDNLELHRWLADPVNYKTEVA